MRIEALVFMEKSPAPLAEQAQFTGVRRLYIPNYGISQIDGC